MAVNYPKEQMHRIAYTKLTPDQILQQLTPAASAGPTSKSALSAALSGKSIKIITDHGPTLNYRFNSAKSLMLSEGAGAPITAGYGALPLKQLLVISHMLPGTQKGYTVILDQRTNLATVFELWFSGYMDNREVQREIYFGYVDDGKPAPANRHTTTSRIQGKGMYWKQDTGVETLEFYPSIQFSSFVELTRFGGELMFCGPSDYVKIDDEFYVYARTECEFSGTFTLHAIDLFNLTQAGLRLGFNEADKLEYYMYTGTGEITGQIATFQPFGDNGDGAPPPATAATRAPAPAAPAQPRAKGQRNAYRPMQTFPKMTEQQVADAVAKNQDLFNPTSQMAGNKAPISNYLAGKSITVRYDGGQAWEYNFVDAANLRFRKVGYAEWHEEKYETYEPADELYIFAHIRSGTRPIQSAIVVLDVPNALTTMVDGQIGSAYYPNEASQHIIMGVMEMDGRPTPRYNRHRFTDELCGHAVTWNYSSSNGLTSMHIYGTPRSASWIIFQNNGNGGSEWSSPANYVRLRDDCYLFSWIEESCNGTQGTIVFNSRSMHNAGFGFNGGPRGVSLSAIGAYARHAGNFDLRKYFGPKQA